jgi:hypothetical protein
MNILEILYEDIHRESSNIKYIHRDDLVNTLYEQTDNGTQICTVYAKRVHDSRKNPNKKDGKAGQPMIIKGTLRSCVASRKTAKTHNEKLSAKAQYKNHKNIHMCAISVNGENYKKYPPKDRTVMFKLDTVTKFVAGRTTYIVK